jgi:hypothetical protein
VHGALGAAQLEVERLKAVLAGECAHTALSLIYRQERDEALAAIERVRAVADRWSKAADLWASEDFDLAAANLYTALREPTS